jgi:hypothetical protein
LNTTMLNKIINLLVSFLLLASLHVSAEIGDRGSSHEAEILRAREISNAALLKKDTEVFISILMPDYHVVTSINGQLSGHDDQRKMMDMVMEKYPDAVYVRTPHKVEVNLSRSTAAESGTWTGKWTNVDKKIELKGIYFAKWTRLDGEWLIQAEIFVILE